MLWSSLLGDLDSEWPWVRGEPVTWAVQPSPSPLDAVSLGDKKLCVAHVIWSLCARQQRVSASQEDGR